MNTKASAELPSQEPFYLLCVDDEVSILKSLTRVFRHESFQVLTATSGQEALTILENTKNIGLILSDQRMPEMSGSEFLEAAKKIAPDIPRMILTGYSDIADAIAAINHGGAQQFLSKPWEDLDLLRTVREGFHQFLMVRENQELHKKVNEQNTLLEEWNGNLKRRVMQQTVLIRSKLEETTMMRMRLQQNSDTLLHMFIDLLPECRNNLSKHSRNTAAVAAKMTASLKLPPAQCEEIKSAALLHDIGLFCAGDEAFDGYVPITTTAEFRDHSVKGEELLSMSEKHKGIGAIIRHHHESYDGSGFPDGLSGEQIPLGSRIINLASFIDNTHVLEDGKETEYQVNSKLGAAMGTIFDPALATAAYKAVKELMENPEP